MRRIAVINQKGGVGKTTTAANLGVALSRRGHSVLLIDLDPQSHLSLHLGVDGQATEPADDTPDSPPQADYAEAPATAPDAPQTPAPDTSVYHVLVNGHPVSDVRRQIGDCLWILPAQRELYHAESELVSVIGRETILSDALDAHTERYDFVLIDCPPSLGILSLNGLCAAEEVLIPMQAHFLALQGVGKLLETIQLVQNRINPDLRVNGVLLCMYDCGTRLGGEVVSDLRSFFHEGRGSATPWSDAKVFHTLIRRNIKLAESPSHGLSVLDYAPKSHGAIDYMRLAGEILDCHYDEAGLPDDNELAAPLPGLGTAPASTPEHADARHSDRDPPHAAAAAPPEPPVVGPQQGPDQPPPFEPMPLRTTG